MILLIKKIVYKIFKRILYSVKLNKYNDFTIAEYFREQGALIGENNRLEIQSLGAEPYLIRIGNHCTLAPGISFITHDGATWLFTEEIPSLQKFGTIEILDNCFIGLNAIILSNITIGPNSVVAAGAVVTQNVPPGTIVGGNPAKVLSTIDEFKEKVMRKWNDIKPDGYFQGIKNGTNYSPEYIHKMKLRDLDMLKKHLEKKCWHKK